MQAFFVRRGTFVGLANIYVGASLLAMMAVHSALM